MATDGVDTLLTRFVTEGEEQLVAAFNQLGRSVSKATGVQKQSTSAMNQSGAAAGRASRGFQNLEAQVSRMSGGLQRAAKTIMTGNRNLDLMSMRLDRASMMMWKFTISAIPLRQMSMYALGAAAGLSAVGVAAINAAADIDRAERAFGAATGSMQKATEVVDYLRDQAPKIRYSLQQVIEAGRILTVAGYDTQKLLYPMADLAAGLGQQGITIANSTRAFVDAMHGEMRRLRNTYDITRDEVERFAAGATDASGRVVDKQRWMSGILAAIAQKYGGANKAAMSGISGQWVNFQDQVTRLAAAFGELLIPEALKFLKFGSALVGSLQRLISMPIVGWFTKGALALGAIGLALVGAAAAAGMFAIELMGLKAAYMTYKEATTASGEKMLTAEYELLMLTQSLAKVEAQRAEFELPMITAQLREQVALMELQVAMAERLRQQATGGSMGDADKRIAAAHAEVSAARERQMIVGAEAAQRGASAEYYDVRAQRSALEQANPLPRSAGVLAQMDELYEREQVLKAALIEASGAVEEFAAKTHVAAGATGGDGVSEAKVQVGAAHKVESDLARVSRESATARARLVGLEKERLRITDRLAAADHNVNQQWAQRVGAEDKVAQATAELTRFREQEGKQLYDSTERTRLMDESRSALQAGNTEAYNRANNALVNHERHLALVKAQEDQRISSLNRASAALATEKQMLNAALQVRNAEAQALSRVRVEQANLSRQYTLGARVAQGYARVIQAVRVGHTQLVQGISAGISAITNLGRAMVTGIQSMVARYGTMMLGFIEMGIAFAVMGLAAKGMEKVLNAAAIAADLASESIVKLTKTLDEMSDRGYDVTPPTEEARRRAGLYDQALENMRKGTSIERHGVPGVAAPTIGYRMEERGVPGEIRRAIAEEIMAEKIAAAQGISMDEARAKAVAMTTDELMAQRANILLIEEVMQRLAEAERDRLATLEKQGRAGGRGVVPDLDAAIADFAQQLGDTPERIKAALGELGASAEIQFGQMLGNLAKEEEAAAAAIDKTIATMKREGASTGDIAAQYKLKADALAEAARLQGVAAKFTKSASDASEAARLKEEAWNATIVWTNFLLDEQISLIEFRLGLMSAMGQDTSMMTDANEKLAQTLDALADSYEKLGKVEEARNARLKAAQMRKKNEEAENKTSLAILEEEAKALEDLGRYEEADLLRKKALKEESEQLAKQRVSNTMARDAARAAGASAGDLGRMETRHRTQERVGQMQLKAKAGSLAAAPFDRRAGVLETEASRASAMGQDRQAYQLEQQALTLRFQSARATEDEAEAQKILNQQLEKRKDFTLGNAQEGIDYADTMRQANELIGSYKNADMWEQRRINRLNMLARSQMAWGDELGASATRLEAMTAAIELSDRPLARYAERLGGMISFLGAAGAPVAKQAQFIRALARAEKERGDQMIASGRNPYDPKVVEAYTSALSHSLDARRMERDLTISQYEVMKEMYDRGMIGEDALNRKREESLVLARQQIAMAKEGSAEQVAAWSKYLAMLDDTGSQMDKTIEKIIGAPGELMEFMSPVDLAKRFGSSAALAMGMGQTGIEVDVLGRYKHRTLIELRYPQTAPPSMEKGITAGIDGFVTSFTRQLEQG